MPHTYTVLNTKIEPEYAGLWSGAVVVDLRRDDGVEGDVWIEAGVPPYLTGTAQACGHQHGLQMAWLFGDSRDCWCPETFQQDDADEILAAAEKAALKAWNEFRQNRDA